MRRIWIGRASALALAGAIGAAGLVACQKAQPPANALAGPDQAPPPVATVPLTDAQVPAAAPAPPASALPYRPVPRVRVASDRDRYAFIDRANRASYGFGDAPPDYAFDYQGSRPWAWQSDNGYRTVVERLPDGGRRYYYYQPGSERPYLVRDPDYAYGYQDGALAVVYDRYGRPLPDAYAEQRSDYAGRYLVRAVALFAAAQAAQHIGVSRDAWYERRDEIARERDYWREGQQRDQGWQAYRDQYDQQYGRQDQSMWAAERYRREAEAARIDAANNRAQEAARERDAAMAAAAQSQARADALARRNQALGQQEAARQAQIQAQQAQIQAQQARLQAQQAQLHAPPPPPQVRPQPAPGQQSWGSTAGQMAQRPPVRPPQVQAPQGGQPWRQDQFAYRRAAPAAQPTTVHPAAAPATPVRPAGPGQAQAPAPQGAPSWRQGQFTYRQAAPAMSPAGPAPAQVAAKTAATVPTQAHVKGQAAAPPVHPGASQPPHGAENRVLERRPPI